MKNILVYGLSNEWGGVEKIVTDIVNNVASENLKFSFILTNKTDCIYFDRVFKNNKNVTSFRMISWGDSPRSFKIVLEAYIKENKFDKLWINASCLSTYFVFYKLKKKYAFSIIFHSHGVNFETNSFIKRIILLSFHYVNKLCFANTIDFKIACSVKSAQWMYGTQKDVCVLPNGINFNDYFFNSLFRNELRKKYELEGKKILLNVGRLSKVKNQTFLIKVMKEVIKKDRNVVLIIIGEGECYDELIDIINNNTLNDNVLLLGYKSNVEKYLSMSDLFLLPSLHEGFPLSIVEAQVSGIYSVLSSNISKEVKLSSNMEFLSILDIDCWVDYILKFDYSYSRNSDLNEKFKKYEISSVASEFLSYTNLL